MSAKVITLAAAARRQVARRRAARRLLAWREAQGLNQHEAAKALGVAVRQLGDWERADRKMPAEVLVLIEEAA